MDPKAYPSPVPIMPITYDYQDQEIHPFVPNNQAAAASSSSSSCVYFHTIQDQTGRYQEESCPLQHHQDHTSYVYNGGSSTTYEIKWKKEDPGGGEPAKIKWRTNDADRGKYYSMSSKTRLMRKMKNHDGLGLNLSSYCTTKKCSYLGINSSNHVSSHDNIPVRVCSDCNTTKTPLWRSGPKGPKTLCNACGIKQRKARRAAAANGTVVAANEPRVLFKIKMQYKEKATSGKNPEEASLLMKRSKREQSPGDIPTESQSNEQKKLGGDFEDLLMKLSKNLTFHRVFPEDEKDAAILLMALSSGLLHG